jgi:hypothetical protein
MKADDQPTLIRLMRQHATRVIALSVLSFIHICNADDNALIRSFLTSCYELPNDPKSEMTDVILMNACYSDERQINKLTREVISRYTNEDTVLLKEVMSDLFSASSMSENANIQLFRERTIGDYYRLDMDKNLTTFTSYAWDNGAFTNAHPFHMAQINVPPAGTNHLWTLYAVQPFASHVSIRTGEHPLLFNEGFYLSLFGLPAPIRVCAILQTIDRRSLPQTDLSNNPGGFQWFKIDQERLDKAASGQGKFGRWAITSLSHKMAGLKQLSLISPDGADRDIIRVIFNGSDPKQKYLAYMRFPSNGSVSALCAWDYDETGNPVRFFRVEHTGSGTLRAWAQYIIHAEKTTIVDWALFRVDTTKFASVFDQRPEYPIQTEKGKVVWDAKRDRYAPLPGKESTAWLSSHAKRIVVRIIVFLAMVVPVLILVARAARKRRLGQSG